MAKKINIAAELNAATVEGILANASQIYDSNQNKSQEEINSSILKVDESTKKLESVKTTLIKEANTDTWKSVPVSNIPSDTSDVFSYTHTQEELSNSWIIIHNMNKFPSVTIIDSDNCLVFADVCYNNENQITINFSKEIKGKVYLI